MEEPGQKPAASAASGPLQASKKAADALQTVVTIGGTVATALGISTKGKPWSLWLGLALLLLSAGWFGFTRWRRRRRRQQVDLPPVAPSRGAYLRGLLPFEQGESLLGRSGDLRQILAKVTSSEFRFGYVSGEAGSGKTSLLRAGLIAEVEKAQAIVVYVSKPGADPAAAIAKAVQRKLGDPPLPESSSLHALLSTAQARLPGQRILVVCDQFEEFCIANRTQRSREPFLQAVGDCHADLATDCGGRLHQHRSQS